MENNIEFEVRKSVLKSRLPSVSKLFDYTLVTQPLNIKSTKALSVSQNCSGFQNTECCMSSQAYCPGELLFLIISNY